MSSSSRSQSDLAQRVTCGFAARAIRHKARQLVGRSGFSLSDREDLEQELRLHLLRRLGNFDPQVAHWNVFVRTLLERHAASLVAHRRVRTRDLEVAGEYGESHEARIDTAMDTAAILAGLPPRARRLCERLKKDTVAEVARQMGIPRSTLRNKVMRLRDHFRTMRLELF